MRPPYHVLALGVKAILLALCLAAGAPQWAAASGPVSIEVVAQGTGAGTAVLGVLFQIEPGWHVYWKNPGEAGLATEVSWELPAGIELGRLLWPAPERFDQPGGIAGYGYRNEVLLAAPVIVPGPGRGQRVGARASWLACKDVCVLGEAEASGVFPPSRSDEERWRPAFEEWRRTLPEDAGQGAHHWRLRLVRRSGGRPGRTGVTAFLRWREPPDDVEWFPGPMDGAHVEVERVETRAGLTRIDMTLVVEKSSDPAGRAMEAVAVVKKGSARRGHVVPLDFERVRR